MSSRGLHIEQVTFDGLPNGSMSDPLTLTHLVQVEISVVAHRSHLVRWRSEVLWTSEAHQLGYVALRRDDSHSRLGPQWVFPLLSSLDRSAPC